MKNLALRKMKSLAFILIIASFLISNIFSIKNKKDAQSYFYENALSFLLIKENDADFKETLEEFNKTYPDTTIVYIDDDKDIYYNPSKIDTDIIRSKANLNDSSINTTNLRDGLLRYRISFISDANKLLFLINKTDFFDYLSYPLLIVHLLLGLLAFTYIDRKFAKDIFTYTSKIKIQNAEDLIKNYDYIELSDILLGYLDELDILKEDNRILLTKLRDFTSVTSNMKEGFILFDGSGKIEWINESAKIYLGIDNKSNLLNLIDDKEYTLAIKEALILKRSKNLDININDYDLRIFIDTLSTSKKKAFAMIIIDNTEQKKAEDMRKEFSANVTHELKSPLTSINGYAELIASGIAKEDDLRKFGEIIYKEGNRLLEIIDDILKISKLDEENFELDLVEVDIYDVVSAIIKKYEQIASKKDLTIVNNIKSFKISTQKPLFYDLISNLYDNAIKYNKYSGSITLDYDLVDNSYFLIIEDTGIGMSQADQKRIFERFYVVDKSRKRNQKSTGLGLSIVKHICSYLAYDIKVDSKLNEGTKFIIEIPLELDREI